MKKCTTPSVNPNVNSRLWVIMMCQCRLINCNKCTNLVGDVNTGAGCVCGGWVKANMGNLYFPLNFIALKKSLFKNQTTCYILQNI